MSEPAIESVALRYGASLTAMLALVLLEVGLRLALPESMPYREPAVWAVALTVTALEIETMGRIERSESPVHGRLE